MSTWGQIIAVLLVAILLGPALLLAFFTRGDK